MRNRIIEYIDKGNRRIPLRVVRKDEKPQMSRGRRIMMAALVAVVVPGGFLYFLLAMAREAARVWVRR